MWHTGDGLRTLTDAEWSLFRAGMSALWERIDDELADPDEEPTEVRAFDSLQLSQQLAMLALVGGALSREDIPAPDLTAVGEATIAAVFEFIRAELETEVDMAKDPEAIACLGPGEDLTTYRRLVLAAYGDAGSDTTDEGEQELDDEEDLDGDDVPAFRPPTDASSDDLEVWDWMAEDLENRILWEDGDYALGDVFLDLPPDERRERMQQAGIDDEYFLALAPDPTEAQLEAIRATLRDLCRDDATG